MLREVEATFFDGNADGFGFEALVFGENILDLIKRRSIMQAEYEFKLWPQRNILVQPKSSTPS